MFKHMQRTLLEDIRTTAFDLSFRFSWPVQPCHEGFQFLDPALLFCKERRSEPMAKKNLMKLDMNIMNSTVS